MIRNKSIISNYFWLLFERIGAQGINFIITIILARLIEPEAYGIVAIVTIITSILQVFIDSGFGNALIQKKDVDDVDYSSVFFLNICICIVLYVFLYLTAPTISTYYNKGDITDIVRVTGLLLIVSGFKNIIVAYISKNLLFKFYFYATLIGTIIAGIVGIVLAINGYGVWALIIENIINQFVDTVILWISIKWKPMLVFSFSKIKKLFNFGWKILVSSLINTIWEKIRQIIIGKKYPSEELAYYNKGAQIPTSLMATITSPINSLLFPILSNEQHDILKVKSITRKSIKITSYVLWPIMTILAVCSINIVNIVLTKKWLPIVPFLKIYCISYAFYPIQVINHNAIKSIGRSDVCLKLEILKKIIDFVVIVFTIRFGIFYIALGTVACSIINQLINFIPNKKYFNYNYLEQIMDFMPSILLSILIGLFVSLIEFIEINIYIKLLLQALISLMIFVGTSVLFKIDSFFQCLELFSKK